ncbi:MAG: VCBS repeat-containing protein, partial [Pirellulales bacterium]|nr:VCBS repeat-containing protein [Pirellulales bacterium]
MKDGIRLQRIASFALALLLAFLGIQNAKAGDGDEETNRGSRVTLVSRSTGLSSPDMEEGNTEMELADVNGDGHLDILSVGDHGSPHVNSGEHGIMVWFGNGAGSWVVHQTGNFGYGGCAAGDLNLDGFTDLAWGIHHDWGSAGFGDKLMGAALGDGTGTNWTPWGAGLANNGETWGMFASALADFDCNGLLDLVSQSFGGGNGLRLYENHGDGTWSQAWSMTGGSVGSTLEASDINADGYPDILSTRSGTNVYLGDGAFGFTLGMAGLPSGTIRGIDRGDINNDGCEDIVFAFGSAGLRCYAYRKATNSWISASNGLPTSVSIYLSQLGDLDGDGFLDITAYADPKGYVFLGDGAGNWVFDTSWTMPSPGHASALRVNGDIDHDGREDIVILASKSGFPFSRNQLRVYSPWLEPVQLGARVRSPLGGETFRDGSIRDIRWLAAIPPSHGKATVDILLSRKGAGGPWTTLASGVPDNGRYQWKIDAFGSGTCRIAVVVTTASGSTTAVSAADFTIIGEDPSLEADTGTIPAAGGSVNFSLNAGGGNKNRIYLLAGSVSGTSPGTLLPGGLATIPLNRDWFTDF